MTSYVRHGRELQSRCPERGRPGFDQVVIPLTSTKAEDVGRAICSGWFRWAGVPKQLLVDLDSAFKGDFLTMMDERSLLVRGAAAQAHWQNGVARRHGPRGLIEIHLGQGGGRLSHCRLRD